MKKYWFKRRRYGYGWVPVTWQGAAATLGYIIVIVLAATWFVNNEQHIWQYFAILILATLVLILVAARTGPRPKWRWGRKETDTAREDF